MRYTSWEKMMLIKHGPRVVIVKKSITFVPNQNPKSMFNIKLPKVTVASLLGLIISVLSLNGNVIGLNEYAMAAIIFGLTSAVSWFFPSDAIVDSKLRPTITVVNITSFLLAMAGYFLDKPVVAEDGTVSYVVPVALLQMIVTAGNIILRTAQTKEANS